MSVAMHGGTGGLRGRTSDASFLNKGSSSIPFIVTVRFSDVKV
jgi:hypothetical protein